MAEQKKVAKTVEQKLADVQKSLDTVEDAIKRAEEKIKELKLKKLNLLEKAEKIRKAK